MPQNRMYQVSTLQALALGYSRAVVSAGELLEKGDCGLGTFTGVDGEMIVMDGQCFRADQNGHVSVVAPETGIPFAAVATLHGEHAAYGQAVAGVGIRHERAPDGAGQGACSLHLGNGASLDVRAAKADPGGRLRSRHEASAIGQPRLERGRQLAQHGVFAQGCGPGADERQLFPHAARVCAPGQGRVGKPHGQRHEDGIARNPEGVHFLGCDHWTTPFLPEAR